MSFLSNLANFYNPKKISENLKAINSSPYKNLKFRYNIMKVVVIVLMVLVSGTIIWTIVKFNGGSFVMTIIGRLVMIVVIVIMLFKFWNLLAPMKKTLEQYEKYPEHQTSTKLDVVKEVDDILEHFKNKEELNK